MGKFYVVEKGRIPGIYNNWEDCKKQINKFKNALFKSYKTKKEAEFHLKNGILNKINNTNNKPNINYNSICVDGACSGNPGKGEYRCVDTKTKEIIFSSNNFLYTTNNLMEFFALVEAIKYILNNNSNKIIYTDSMTAMSWVKNKKVNTTLILNDNNYDSHLLIKKYEKFLKNNNINHVKIEKWNTKLLGEIPADFGRK